MGRRQLKVVSQEGASFQLEYRGSPKRLMELLSQAAAQQCCIKFLVYLTVPKNGIAKNRSVASYAEITHDTSSFFVVQGKYAKYEHDHQTVRLGIYPENKRLQPFTVFIRMPQDLASQMKRRKNYRFTGPLGTGRVLSVESMQQITPLEKENHERAI
ncbi:hypothetical protein [Deinococcus roseus]|uniref:hypothetical protein n=1 Tax=Deinococcus roseus TaxID=392414 RepID=UPI001665C3F0|nr:hypothetical protein [Deinococcus roseus]